MHVCLSGVHMTIPYVRAVPARKCNANRVRVETLCELHHTVHNNSSLPIPSLSRGVVYTQMQSVCS